MIRLEIGRFLHYFNINNMNMKKYMLMCLFHIYVGGYKRDDLLSLEEVGLN